MNEDDTLPILEALEGRADDGVLQQLEAAPLAEVALTACEACYKLLLVSDPVVMTLTKFREGNLPDADIRALIDELGKLDDIATALLVLAKRLTQ